MDAMNEIINRLAKGITETEKPKAELSPASFSESVNFAESGRREFSLRSINGIGLKGLVYSDNPRVRIENAVFTGGRNRIFFQVDTSFLKEGTVIFGRICLITNAGEFAVPYRFTAEGQSVYDRPETEETEGVVLSADQKPHCLFSPGAEQLTEMEAMLSENFPEDPELFSELVSLLIREQQTGRFAFLVYQEAVRRDLRMTRLYEYYIYSFPDDFEGEIPREVLLYFSYDTSLDRRLKSVIYKNVLQYADPSSELYRHYEPEIRDYALQSVFQGKIDDKLAVIYAHMLYPDMIDPGFARILPSLLKSQRVLCMDSRMRKVIVRYPELRGEETYSLSNGIAYVPVYFSDAQILFMDHYGRYYEGVQYEKQPLIDKPELLERCFALDPAQPMVMLAAAKKILAHGVQNENEQAVLTDVLNRLPLRRAFSEQIAEALIASGGSLEFLKTFDADGLPGTQKQRIFRAFAADGQWLRAFAMARRYGLLIAETEPLSEMTEAMLSEDLVPHEDDGAEHFFLSACRRLFDEGRCGTRTLSYLAKVYEGATEDMYAIACAVQKAGADPAALLERTLAAKLFAGTQEHLDETFELYRKNSPRELLVRAYLSVRADDYFVRDKKVPEGFFDALLQCIETAGDRSRLPSLYALAWTKYIAEQWTSEEQAEKQRTEKQQSAEKDTAAYAADVDEALLRELLDNLIADGLVFSYTKGLLERLHISSEITEKTYIEYHGDRYRKPRLLIRIEPEDETFHEEEMRRVYQGIYLWERQLFSDDRLHYMIYDGDGTEPASRGILTQKRTGSELLKTAASRYAVLDRMTAAFLSGEERKLQEEMKAYVLRSEMTDALFDVRE